MLSSTLRRKGVGVCSDDRVLGGSDFVERMLAEADEKEKERLRLSGKVRDLGKLARRISKGEEIEGSALRSGRRQGEISRVRRLLCQVAVGKVGYPAAKVARFLGVTTSAVVRAAYSEICRKWENTRKFTQKQHPLYQKDSI